MLHYLSAVLTWTKAVVIQVATTTGITILLLQFSPVQAQTEPRRITTTFSYTPLIVDKHAMGFLLVPVKLIDKDHIGTFLLDTGTGYTAVTETMAAKLNLVPKPMIVDGKPFLVAGQPVNGVHLAVLQVGQLPVAGDAVVLKDKDLSTALGATVDGVLGANMLGVLAVLFDFSKHEITLWYPGSLTDADVQRLGFTGVAIPLAEGQGENEGVFTTKIQTANNIYHGQDDFVIDTGSNHTRLSYSLSQQLKLSPLPGSFSPAASLGGPVGSCTALLQTLKVGQFTISNHLVDCPAQARPGQYSPSILGMDKLSRFRVLLDFATKKMYLQPVAPLTGPAGPPPVPAPQSPAPQSAPPAPPPAK